MLKEFSELSRRCFYPCLLSQEARNTSRPSQGHCFCPLASSNFADLTRRKNMKNLAKLKLQQYHRPEHVRDQNAKLPRSSGVSSAER